jgi:dihydrodipicolinate synthase/N-acetylneuraminate lyase
MDIEVLRKRLLGGLVIPACPLPLFEDRTWSQQHQRAIARYYHAAGAGGIAVGVHSTQFAIRDPDVQLFEPVLRLVRDELVSLDSNMVRIAGVCGRTDQAIREAEFAHSSQYDAGLLSLGAMRDCSEIELIEHCQRVAEVIPLVGFYLQGAVGGRVLSHSFWRSFSNIESVVAIKVAPFNRYQTWDVVRAVIESGRDDIALYTGNDDNIIVDLLTPFSGTVNSVSKTRFFDGGLLGQWGVWTNRAVAMLKEIKLERAKASFDNEWLRANVALTDLNAAVFDAANGFAGCIPGIMEILRRVGLAPSNACLNESEALSPGQVQELDRVIAAYPQFVDDDFVKDNLERWLKISGG